MEYTNKLAENVHKLILDIDSELATCVDFGLRQRLVKTIYILQDLEHLLISRKVDESIFTRIQKVLSSV